MSGKEDKLISIQDAIEAVCDEIMSRFDVGVTEGYELVEDALSGLPYTDAPDTNVGDIINCTDCIKHGGDWECDRMHCHKGTKQQATVSSGLISRQDAITLPVMPKEHREYQTFNLDDAYEQGWNDLQKCIELLPSAESVKAYTKADYIMALHKEYGCTLTMAEEAHNKALEHLRSKARMKG